MSRCILFHTTYRSFFDVSTIVAFVLLGTELIQAATPLDSWHQRACPIASASLNAIAYGNGRFVVNADTLNRVLTSTNGVDWELHPAPYPNLRTVTFGNGVFIASFLPPQGSEPQRIYTSTDGVSWTLRFIAPDFDITDIRSIECGNGEVIAAGTSIWLSSDLTNWTASLYGTVSFTRLAFLNGMFVASDGSSLWSSADAYGWTYRSSSAGGAKVVAGNGKFCAVGYPSGRTLLSPDGINWSQSATTNVPPPFTLGPLTFAGGYFIALGNTATPNLLLSTNGQDWDSHSFGTNLVANAIAYGSSTFVAVGNGSVILQSDTATGPIATPPVLGISQVPNLTINGEPGRDYQIEYTDDMANQSFQPLAIVHMESTQLTWVDVTATNAVKRFYRAVVVP